MANNTRIVIGIDPASGKGSYVFAPDVPDPAGKSGAGIDRTMTPSELREMLPSRRATTRTLSTPFGVDSCLECWDAPLTGPPYPDADDPGVMTIRQIEVKKESDNGYFEDVAKWAKDNEGVALRPYSGLSHWVISRNLLGLPRTGIYDAPYSEIPLYPVFSKNALRHYRFAVTEVHPALAIAAWLKEEFIKYKNLKADAHLEKADVIAKSLEWIWRQLRERVNFSSATCFDWTSTPKTDDALDARVAWLLGHLWLQGSSVQIIGNEQDGTFLIPTSNSTSN